MSDFAIAKLLLHSPTRLYEKGTAVYYKTLQSVIGADAIKSTFTMRWIDFIGYAAQMDRSRQ